MTKIIDGRAIAERIREDIQRETADFASKHGHPPGLGVVLAGGDPASAQYVRMKRRACEAAGIHSVAHVFSADCTHDDVLNAVHALNDDPQIHGILVQLPLFDQIDEEAILEAVRLDKDVDGFHPVNIGTLGMKGREPLFTPATPTGCMVLLQEIGAEISGANAVVVGRSNIVGLPVALMLLKANATVTVAHSRTKDLPAVLQNADIVIAAAGIPNYIQGEWLKAGATVIDVGTNRIDDPDSERGYRFVGDVDLESARGIVGAITRVPGGVGPMTITMLLQNTIKAAWRIAAQETEE
ncbi:MAG: bifunctional 5,10-methylenetetrahydrofolate dehydrogenase/5,10-methenyltetrahydrofolate cyclohydrolase [Anaerolineaceae bacterium]|nr:MAG: bifunctional 5,10-methylenetetrahydrofolate dehydrogenase/5,10-methenyltetrahydrofolate cyclohydrolase [Anaerolineaceae bacterium]